MPGSLGMPNEYEVFIVDSLTQETVDVVPWTSLTWGRTLNGVSRASVTCRRQKSIKPKWYDMAPLRAWDRMLVIQRNGFTVWDGPVLGWSSDQTLRIDASDRSAALAKRLVSSDIVLDDGLGPYALYTSLLSPAISGSGLLTAGAGQMPYSMTVFDAGGPILMNDVQAVGVWRFKQLISLQSLFDQLARSAFLCWTQRDDTLVMFIDRYGAQRTGSPGYLVIPSGTLRPEYIVSDTGDVPVTVRADSLATGVYKGDTGQGIAGFPNSVLPFNTLTYTPYGLYDVLTDANVGEIYWTNEAGSVRVDPQQYVAPCPVVTLEQVTLSSDYYLEDEEFLTDLSPGRVLRLDFPNSWNLNTPIVSRVPDVAAHIKTVYSDRVQYARIDDVSFTVSRTETGLTEKAEMSFTARATG